MLASVKSVLKNKEFAGDKVQEWLATIFEDVLRHLSVLGPRFKYCATGIITQNCGAGLQMANACRYEKNTDSTVLFLIPDFGVTKYQEGSVLCTLVVYGFRI
jgi:hypothetical protein